jgi:SAM-dependent methyltransferase
MDLDGTQDSKAFYERTSERFWDPRAGLAARDRVVYPLLAGTAGRVLEYGCGAGSLLLALAKEQRFTHCIGVDISERALTVMQEAWREMQRGTADAKLSVMVPSSERLPKVADQSVDVVISVATIEHVFDPYAVLDECHRIAAPHAVLVAAVPNYAYVKHVVGLLFGIQPRTGTDEPVEKWRSVGWDGGHLHTFTKSSFEVLLRDCGWIPQRWTGWGRKFSSLGFNVLRTKFPALFSGELLVVCRKH